MARMEIIPTAQGEAPANLDTYLSDPLDKIIAGMDFKQDSIKKIGDVIKPIAEKRLDEFKLIATVWSPPKWMKSNNNTVHGGKLRADRREHFGKFLAAYCKGFEQLYGVPVYAVSIQNELMFDEPYNSCLYNPDTNEYHDAVLAVVRAFKKYGVEAKLFGPEHMANDARGGWFYGGNLKFIGQIAKDKETLDGMTAWAFHGYAADGKTSGSSRKGWENYREDLKGYGKELWMTETSGTTPAWIAGGKGGALALGVVIHDALACGNINAWVYWSFQDGDRTSGYNLTAHGDKTSRKYCVAKHFFRYIRPGAVRVEATPDTPDLNVCAFVHDAQKTITVVLVNMTTAEQAVTLTLPAAPAVTALKVFRTSAAEAFSEQAEAPVTDGKASLKVPGQSIVTLTAASAQAARKKGSASSLPATLEVKAFGGLLIARAKATPALDGQSEAGWNAAKAYELTHVVNGEGVKSKTDLAGTVRAMWDEKNLYLRYDITDDSNNGGAQPGKPSFDHDGVELYLDGDNSRGYSYDSDDFQFLFTRGVKEAMEVKHNKTNNVSVSTSEVVGGYRVVAVVPWATTGLTPKVGAFMGFDAHVNDNDNGKTRKGKLAWHAQQDDVWESPARMGTAKLGE